MDKIRNFCIIAHIDHGKSTLADRMLELTGTVDVRQMENQVLDDMELEKERGITIKSHAIQMQHKGYTLNLIDTPGHVDFSYEVSRSIAACEGAVLVVDATQGVQAQTISNLYMAIEHDLEIIPVLNKCDMENAMPERVEDEIVDLLGCKREEILRCSAKTGEGVPEILDEGIASIRSEAENMQQLIEELLFLARADQKRQVLHKERLELSELVADIMKKMQLVATKHEVELRRNDEGEIQRSKWVTRSPM